MGNRITVLLLLSLLCAVALRGALKYIDMSGPGSAVLASVAPAAAAVFLIANIRMAGAKLALVGVLLNLLVIAANGGSMPVVGGDCGACAADSNLSPARHVMATDAKLSLFADRLQVPGSDGKVRLSVGDVALATGLLWMSVMAGVRTPPPWGRGKANWKGMTAGAEPARKDRLSP